MRYFTDIFSKITFRTMRQNRMRTAVTIIGVILSSAMITAVAAFSQSIWTFLKDYSISHDGNWYGVAEYVSDEEYRKIREDSDVEMAAATDILGYARYGGIEDGDNMPYLYIQSLPREVWEIYPAELAEGRLPENEHEVIISSFLRSHEGQDQTRIGDVLELEVGQRNWEGERLTAYEAYIGGEYAEENGLPEETLADQKPMTFTVVGIYSSAPNFHYGTSGIDVYAGPSDSGKLSAYHDVYIRTEKPSDIYRYMETIECDQTSVNSPLLRWLGVADNGNLAGIVTGLGMIVTGIIMAGAVSLIYNAFSISLRERTMQFGLLASVGATRKQLGRSMICEALFVSCVGIPAGCIAGIAGIGITLRFIGKGISSWIHGESLEIPLRVSWIAVAGAVLTAFVTVMISVWIPYRRVRRISPVDAIRSGKDIRVRKNDRKAGVLWGRIFGLEGMLAGKNYKRDQRKYRSTVASLTISMVLFVSVSVYGEYLIQTGTFVTEMPEVQLVCQVADGDRDSWEEVLGRAEELAEQNDDVTFMQRYESPGLPLQIDMQEAGTEKTAEDSRQYAYLYIISDDLFERLGGSTDETRGLPLLYPEYVKFYNSETERYERHEAVSQPGVIRPVGISDSGEDGEVQFRQLCSGVFQGKYDKMPEGIVYPDFGLSLLTCESAYDIYLSSYPDLGRVYSLGIQCTNHVSVYRELSEKLGSEGHYLFDNADSYEQSRRLITAARVLAYGFVVLISLIAVANVFNTISANLMLRRREFAMLRSVGMPRRGFVRMLCCECLIYGGRSVVYGIILSMAVSVLIYRVIVSGADTSYIMPWKYLAGAVVFVFIVVGITMIYTMHGLRRQNIIDELKMD